MIKLSKNLEYALLALKFMLNLEANDKLNVKTLAVHLNAPFDSLSRVMQKLAHAKIIASEQGVSGGYKLNVCLQSVNLHDLIQSLQGPLEIVKCMSEDFECSMHLNCDIKAPVMKLNDKLIHFYRSITLQELLASTDLKPTQTQEAQA